MPDNLNFSIDERIIFAQICSECRALNAQFSDALACLKKYLADYLNISNAPGCAWDSAVKLYLADCERRGVRPSTLRGYKFHAIKLKRETNISDVKLISGEIAKKYLSIIKYPDRAKRALCTFFNFCKEMGWLTSKPFLFAETPRILREKEHPHIMTPADYRRLLSNIPIEWQPAFTLMAFVGLRPNEVVRKGSR